MANSFYISQLKLFSSSLALLFVLIITFSSSVVSSDNNALSAYQVLQEYNFPKGILPEGVIGYQLNEETGEFKAFLNGTCTFPVDAYDLRYKSTITGVISRNKITNLGGVSVKILFVWLNIVEVIRDGDDLDFSVGITSASFPLYNFLESPKCGCGFFCVSGGRIKVKSSRFISAV